MHRHPREVSKHCSAIAQPGVHLGASPGVGSTSAEVVEEMISAAAIASGSIAFFVPPS